MIERLEAFSLIGVLLIILGLLFLILPILQKLGASLENIHPLIFWGKRLDGIYIGTSPILIIILAAVYLAFSILRRSP